MSDVIQVITLNCKGLFVPRPQRVGVYSLTGRGKATHRQVQTLFSLGNWLVVVTMWFLFHTLTLCLTLLLLSEAQWLLEKSSKWRQMPWSFTAFNILACLLWHFYCIPRKRALLFPFLLKPQAPSVVISVQHPWCSRAAVSVCLSPAILVTHWLLLSEEGQMSRFKFKQLSSYPLILFEEGMGFFYCSVSFSGTFEKIYTTVVVKIWGYFWLFNLQIAFYALPCLLLLYALPLNPWDIISNTLFWIIKGEDWFQCC